MSSAGSEPLRAGGFTLLELMVVMAIAGLLLTVVPPLFSAALPGVQLKGAAREIASALRFARDRAVTRQEASTLTLDLESRKYWVSGRERAYSLPSGLDVELFTVSSEQTDEDTGAIRFFPDGSSTGGRVTLAVGDSSYAVDVDWLTGRVRVQQ